MTFTDASFSNYIPIFGIPIKITDKRFVPKVLVEMFLVLREYLGGYNRDLKAVKNYRYTGIAITQQAFCWIYYILTRV